VKKLLLISYYFPPAGGVSVQRVLKFAKYLPQFGWQPIILTIEDGSFPALDRNLSKQLPADIPVYRVKGWDPFQYYAKFVGKKSGEGASTSFSSDREIDWKERLARKIRGNFFIPDARKGWVKPAIEKGLEIIEADKIDAVFSSGPPHSTHLIAKGIRAEIEIPWIADFRDLWTEIDYKDQMPQGNWAAAKNASLEKGVLEMADLVTTVSPSCRLSLENLGHKINCAVIPNGFDPEDYISVVENDGLLESEPLVLDSDRTFVISYAGTLGPARNPSKFWDLLAELKEKKEVESFALRFFGTVDSSIRSELESKGLLDHCDFRGSVSHKSVLGEMTRSDLLLLVINRVEETTMAGITPGKMYEYMASGVPTLGVGLKSGDAAKILESTKSGIMVNYEDSESMKDYFKAIYAKWQSASADSLSKDTLRLNDPLLKAYNRIEQSATLASHLENILVNG